MKKPRPTKAIGSKRRAVGWMLLTLGLLVAGVWLWSGFYEARGHFFPTRRLQVMWAANFGRIEILFESYRDLVDEPTEGNWYVRRLDSGFLIDWSQYSLFKSITPRTFDVILPLAMAATPLLLAGGGLLYWGRRARRRALEGHCPTCGYNLAGLNADAPCPECGRNAAATA